MSIIGSNVLAGASGQAGGGGAYEIERSVRFNSSDSAYLSRVFTSSGDRTKWTWAAWIKRSSFSSLTFLFHSEVDAYNETVFFFNSSDQLELYNYQAGSFDARKTSSAVFRDPSAWYHIVVAWDTANATAADRVRLYANGSRITSFSSSIDPAQNTTSAGINVNRSHRIGSRDNTVNYLLNGCLADVFFVDAQGLDPTSFGEFDTNGVWQPIDASGLTFGTTGFHLPCSDNSTAAALGTDTSGNSNTWTVNNISVTAGAGNDSLVDTPTSYGTPDTGVGGEVRGNYCTFNPLNSDNPNTLTNGNLDSAGTGSGGERFSYGTIAASSGKWYYEMTVGSGSVNNHIGASDSAGRSSFYISYQFQGNLYYEGGLLTGSWGASFTNGDVIGAALDLDNGAIYFSKNGTWQASGVPTSGASKTGAARSFTPRSSTPLHITYNTANVDSFNFGQRPFAYTAPSGFKALCTTNLPEPTIADGSTVFEVITYQGNGTTQTLPNTDPTTSPQEPLNFSPDFVWIKRRDLINYYHELHDIVRGTSKALFSNSTDAESARDTLTSFNSDGFTVGTQGGVHGGTNASGGSYVGWTWDAGGTTDPSNEAGSITSQVRANASAGFSVVTYTGNGSSGATVGHGLGAKPFLRIIKRRDATSTIGWMTFHESAPTSYFTLNSTNAATPSSEAAPTSTVFSLPADANSNASGGTYVAYCFAPVAGYSAYGSYTGNGSADGPFVFTGFRPRWVMIKCSSSTGDWAICDTQRGAYNEINVRLLANEADPELSGVPIDTLSNGFKIRNTFSVHNTNGATYVWAAFAEHPFATARAR